MGKEKSFYIEDDASNVRDLRERAGMKEDRPMIIPDTLSEERERES